ncbi:GNAT family N-acetyltransferase [Kocuria indica]|uniref:GNAT family N-acetyltransferase n=1 Tax=Kocuria marina subsp. indica TaxID=1049583 RepID=A0A6N9R306_9MICC|nr:MULTISPECIES: GNAT family protein [Kocuria]MCT1616769.1 GNAT family N-acetyltransferase [Kocuria marina]NDO79048.1 GNAT family N-acetyltransferase [Kocuria indica]
MVWTPVTLRGRLVRLEPLSREHLDGLIEATEDGRMWERWYASVADPDGMAVAVEQRLTWQDEGFMLPFVTVRQADDAVLGMTTFYDPQWDVPRLSVGHTWNRASTHGTGTNVESKLLLMTHAFEELGCRCVRYETSWANQQSRTAIERLGARLDGVLRADRLERNGVLRDTVVYSVLEHEWPSVKAGLEARVARR